LTGTLPKKEDVRLILAEDARIEQGMKFSLLGYYLGNRIIVADVGPAISIQLAFLVTVDDGEGTFDFVLKIKAPSGNEIIADSTHMKKLKDTTAVHMIRVINFPVLVAGHYACDVSLDGHMYNLGFSIQHNPAIKDQFSIRPPT
jgi:hypothetical protein